MKTVYNKDDGSEVIAYDDPVDGGIILPAGAVDSSPPEFDWETHNCVYNEETQKWDVTLKPIISETPDPIVYEEPEDLIKAMRQIRNGLLASSDYRLLPDYTGSDVAAWKTYRQALRDVPQNNSSPTWNSETGEIENVNWPTPPST